IQTKMPLLNVSTENDFAGERKSCLATKEIDVALIGRHRDGGAAIANVADNPAAFALQLHAFVPELAHGDFLRRSGGHEAEAAICPRRVSRSTDDRAGT